MSEKYKHGGKYLSIVIEIIKRCMFDDKLYFKDVVEDYMQKAVEEHKDLKSQLAKRDEIIEIYKGTLETAERGITKRDKVIENLKRVLETISIGGVANMPPNELSLKATRKMAKQALPKADAVLKEK